MYTQIDALNGEQQGWLKGAHEFSPGSTEAAVVRGGGDGSVRI